MWTIILLLSCFLSRCFFKSTYVFADINNDYNNSSNIETEKLLKIYKKRALKESHRGNRRPKVGGIVKRRYWDKV